MSTNKKEYEEPSMITVEICSEDIITASGDNDGKFQLYSEEL